MEGPDRVRGSVGTGSAIRARRLPNVAAKHARDHEKSAIQVSPGLATRIEEIPGVLSVSVDLTEAGGGINLRLEPGTDEVQVMERVRALLGAYGTRPPREATREGKAKPAPEQKATLENLGVDLKITPIPDGARVEVMTPTVRSFRVVPAEPAAIAQGVADAWSQVLGRVPVEVISVTLGNDGGLQVVVSDGEARRTGSGNVSLGWERALAEAVGVAIGATKASGGAQARST